MSGAFAGRVALVTGASRGIGAAIAHSLAARGAHVILVARKATDLEAVEDAIHNAGGTATIVPLDITDGEGVSRLAGAVAQRWERLDMLVLNAAGLGTLAPLASSDMAEVGRLFTLNVIAQHGLIAAFEPLLRRSDAGRVVALTSSVGRTPRAYWGPYAASKAALENLIATFGDEMARISNVRTAIVDPGATRTTMRARAFPGEDKLRVKEPAVVGEAVADLLGSDFASTAFVRVEG